MQFSSNAPDQSQPLSILLTMLLIGVGAAVGANLRYWVGLLVASQYGTAFPYGTMLINLVGSLLIGMVLGYGAGPSMWLRLLLVTGCLGGFTTFSSFSWETYDLIMRGRFVAAVAYIVVSSCGGLAATALGVQIVRALVSKP